MLADADLEDAARQVVRGAMLATGQRCTATGRVYVERPVAQRFTELLREQIERLVVGDPFDEATEVGKLAFPEQRETAGVEPQVPFGGVKGSSSMNREQGKAARQFFTTTKTVYLRST